jgi:transcription elongation factor Elf1
MKAPLHHIEAEDGVIATIDSVVTFECPECKHVMCDLYLTDKGKVDITVHCRICDSFYEATELWVEEHK